MRQMTFPLSNKLEYPDCESIVKFYTEGIRAMFGKTSNGPTRDAKGDLAEKNC